MRARDLDRCRTLPLFANVAPDAMRDLAAGAHLQRFPAGALLLREGDAADLLYVLLEGQVGLHGAWNDQETVLAILRPISTFILATVVLETDALMSARTLERSEVLLIPGEAVRRAIQYDPQFATAVSRDLAGGYHTMVRAAKSQKLRSGIERLANYLVMLQATDEPVGPNMVVLHHEKRVLASLLGMTPENLSRAFAALRNYGVSVSGALVTITNLVALRALAKPDALVDGYMPHSAEAATSADAELWSAKARPTASARRRASLA